MFLSHLCTCKLLKSVDLSFNTFEIRSIRNLFTECSKIEEAGLVNVHHNEEFEENLIEIIKTKFEEENFSPLKRIELRTQNSNEKSQLIRIFKSAWLKNNLKLIYLSRNVIEIKII